MKKRLLSVLLALVMVVGVLPTAAFAAEEEINYVSIGDSMTNGYCFDGYEQGNGSAINFFEGTGVYGEDAYPLQFEEYLEDQGYEVKHTMLAPSAQRAEDLLYLLGGREEPQDGWQNQVNGYTEVYDDAALADFYQKAVKEADIITMGIGNASFGAYMLHRVTDALGVFGAELDDDEKVDLEDALIGLDEEQKQVILEAYAELKAEMEQYIPAEMADKYNVEEVCGILAYTAAGFLLNYKGVLEKIVELNEKDDLEVILVGLMNTTYGMNITDEDGEVLLPIGDIMDGFFGALNAYVAGLPVLMQSAEETAEAWEDVTFYYAEQPEPKFISQQFAALKDSGWTEVDRLSGDIVRDRNIDAYNSDLRDMIGSALGTSLAEINLDDVKGYERDREEGNLSWNPFYDQFGNVINPIGLSTCMSVAIYLGIEDAVAESCDTMDIPLTGLMKIAGDLSSVFTDIDATAWFAGGPEGIHNNLASHLTSTDELKGMCKIYALFKVGNGMSVHPTPEGHDEIAASVIAAYEGKHTASDETVENLKEAYQFLLANYEEIYKIAYKIAESQGYIAEANGLLEELKANVSAINVAELGLSAELQAEVEALIAEILEDIEAIQAIVNSPDHPTAEFYALMSELAEDLGALQKVAAQADKELYTAVMALQAKLEKAFEEALETVDAQLREAYETVVNALTDLAEEYGPAAEEFLRTWLYENPKAVLETILAYGEDIDAMLNHWNYHLGLILGPAWNAYGDDLMALLEDLLEVLNSEAAALTEEAAAQLIAYIKGLELDTQIEAIANAVMNGSATIGEETLTELKDIVDELNENVESNVDNVIAALEKLAASKDAKIAKETIETAIKTVLTKEAELKAQIKAIEKDIEDVEEQLQKAVTYSDQIPDIVKGIRKLLNNPEETLDLSKTITDVEQVLKTICGTVESVQEAADLLVTLTGDITTAAKEINAELIALNGELETAVGAIETTLTAAGVDAEALLGETCAAIDAFVTTTADTVITDANALVAACELELTAAVNELIAAIENALYKATHGDVTVDCVATYTAIGDEADAYTSDLAELLGVKVAALNAETDLVTIEFGGEELSAFVNGQIAGMVAETVKANEDLVKILNSNAGAMILAELDKMGIDLEAEVADLAWEKYLDETAIGVKDETLAGIAQVLMDHDAMMETYTLDVGAIVSPIISAELGVEITVDCIVEIPVAELVIAAVDNLLYAYVDTAAQCVAAIEGIREVAPEAEVVILGLTDAAEELDLKIGNIEIDLGEYEDAIGTFANAHYFAYALLNGEDVTFVAEKDAEAIYAALNVTELGHDWVAVVTAPTCTEAGYTTYTCSKCGETYTADETAATGHAWGAWTDNGDGTHSRVCANDASHIETEAHDFTNGDCVCGAKKPAEEEDHKSSGGSSRDWHCPTCKTDVCHSKAYTDLDLDAWYHKYTDYVLCKKLMIGMSDTIFAPNAETTRAMLTTILYRIAGAPAVTGEMPFADVDEGQWYSDAILWAAQNDVVLGYGDGNFGPMDVITREQIAALFCRFAELKGMKTELDADLASFKDAAEISAWASGYMEWAVASGMMEGRGAKTLAPLAGTTRAETAALLERWCEEIAD